MVATVNIREHNGSSTGPTQTAKTTAAQVRFKNADNATVDSNNRLIIPTANTEYSYTKYIKLQASVAPDVDIDNLQAYSDGANGFGTGVKVWYWIKSVYVTPSVPTETNDPPHYPGSTEDGVDYFALTSGSPGDMDAITTGPFTGTGDMGDFLVLCMEVETSASQGSLTAESLTFRYDET